MNDSESIFLEHLRLEFHTPSRAAAELLPHSVNSFNKLKNLLFEPL